ncbi:MAG TPA: heat-inducible transcriptional repressor HrcA [Spirochaetota bacterium]|jgi:heat-inducible transcriptional repressor|nr:MAG: Heat-inducible transcription repressor HrcA [Spirochaetes bacterium ADurb.Bin218]HON15504.1 heat-inducible transcriptional repressor HrcA [Spirochaetota bacterium]HPD77826.1 heat-inducible transcriptional repressor HrcA [Spirochaetota bacterium]HPP95076.1 heat-inducible transcriptional repressor HrcA [Spirochaetota bacterium]HRS62519.1 heat-inducible transcriptional repressor HrcA [Spirochaetota bacterium]
MKKVFENERMLDERESAVLNSIVYEYIATGKAVGSRSFVQKYSFSLSPATMRNIMYDLERMGYLMQPHTSAGRVPTDKGYRYYVNSLLDSYDSTFQDLEIEEKIFQRELQLDKIFESVTKMLSVISNYAGVMLSPNPDFTILKLIELIQLESNEVLVIIVTRTGMILTKKVNISVRVTQDELSEYSKFLTRELCGYSLNQIKENIFKELRDDRRTSTNKELALDIAQIALSETGDAKINIDGIENLLRLPEMVEESRLKSLLNIIEEKNILKEILEQYIETDGINILIGEEIENEKISGCSLVASSYKIGNKPVGAVGVIGPTRMDYEKVVPLVDYTGKAVTGLLTKMSK